MDLPEFDPPEFFNLDEEIRKFQAAVDNHKNVISQIETDHYTKHNTILAKIEQLRKQLEEMHGHKFDAMRKARNKYEEDFNTLAALRRQKAEEAKNKQFDATVQLIKEIVAEFPAWEAAREYQIEDIVTTVHQFWIGGSGIMNANEMALGKTFEAFVSLYICMELFRRKYGKEPTILWLSKSSIIQTGGTFAEAKRWFPELKIYSLDGSSNKAGREIVFEFAETGGVCVLTNYETIKTTPAAQKIHWDFVIMDEVHKLKGGANSSPTAIFKAIEGLSMGFQMMLTGTPMANKFEEIWAYLHLFDPELFPDVNKFKRQFYAFRDISGKLKFSLQSEKMLKDILRGRLIRRTAHEVGLQLPEVVYQEIMLPHNLEQGDLYKQMKESFFIWLDKQEKNLTAMSILAQLTRLRQINVLPVATFKIKDENGNVIEEIKLDCRDSSKLDEAVEIIQKTQDQVLVFSSFNEPLRELAFRLQVEGITSAIISSDTKSEMGTYETDFQAGKIDVLLINNAMGEGLNLHKDSEKWEGGARAVITLDRWWNNARNDQCIKRAVRPGKNSGEPVFVYDLYCIDSVDFFIKALCDDKDEQFRNFTEDSNLRPSADWKEYLKGLL